MLELIGENGFTLTVGVSNDFGCVQHGSSDGLPPYLMAVELSGRRRMVEEIEFLVADTPTPIHGQYCIPIATVNEIVREFAATGKRSSTVSWEEF
jgi:hypothetical protein